MGEVWIEKYRPAVLEEIEGNVDVIAALRQMAATGSLQQHLLLAGPPGTGKTTTVLALARIILGPARSRAVLELNASDERGIDVVRQRIKSFAQEVVSLPAGKHKIIILDEVDSMTEAAQQSLRRLIELHASTTRFALACNDSTKVIEPLQSRCCILRFGRLRDEHIAARVKAIAEKEGVGVTADGLLELVHSAEGDMRNAINNLQSVAFGFGQLSRENVLQVCDAPSRAAVERLLKLAARGELGPAMDAVRGLVRQGYTPADIVSGLQRVLRGGSSSSSEGLAEVSTLEFLKIVCRTDMMMQEGVASLLQVDALLAKLSAFAAQYAVAAATH